MKIAINGDIIDTKNIYKIEKIITGYWERHHGELAWMSKGSDFGFSILLFNKHELIIKHYDKFKVESIRNKLIKIWSNNQSEIPQFNLL